MEDTGSEVARDLARTAGHSAAHAARALAHTREHAHDGGRETRREAQAAGRDVARLPRNQAHHLEGAAPQEHGDTKASRDQADVAAAGDGSIKKAQAHEASPSELLEYERYLNMTGPLGGTEAPLERDDVAEAPTRPIEGRANTGQNLTPTQRLARTREPGEEPNARDAAGHGEQSKATRPLTQESYLALSLSERARLGAEAVPRELFGSESLDAVLREMTDASRSLGARTLERDRTRSLTERRR